MFVNHLKGDVLQASTGLKFKMSKDKDLNFGLVNL